MNQENKINEKEFSSQKLIGFCHVLENLGVIPPLGPMLVSSSPYSGFLLYRKLRKYWENLGKL